MKERINQDYLQLFVDLVAMDNDYLMIQKSKDIVVKVNILIFV